MASRQATVTFAYPRRASRVRSATQVDRRSLMLVVGLLTLMTLAGVLYLAQASTATELRFALMEQERAARDLSEQNLILRKGIAERERLTAVEERAVRLGMVQAPATEARLIVAVPREPAMAVALGRVTGQPRFADAGGAGPASSVWESLLRRLGLASSPASGGHIVLNAAHP